MGDTSLDLVKTTKSRLEVYEETKFGAGGVILANLAQAKTWATEIAESGMAPKGMDTPAKVLLACQTGMELGFTPMRSLQAVVIVNGRATLMGEAALGLIRASGKLKLGTDIELGWRHATEEEKLAKEGHLVGFCRTQREGESEKETLFSQGDAVEAQLWGGKGPWSTYPKRMLQWRAVGFHMRDFWSDIGNGLMLNDEAQDLRRPMRDVTPSAPKPAPAEPDPLMSAGPAEEHTEPPTEIFEAEVVEEDGRVAEAQNDRDGYADNSEGEISHDMNDADAEPPEDFESKGEQP